MTDYPPLAPPRFGFISHVVGSEPSRTVINRTVELATYAEEVGFDSFWVAQHHFGAQRAHCPSPLVLLSAIAAQTSRIRLGTAVVIGSLEDPIRLAEDASMLDILSNGRVELGLGAGANESTARRFGHDHARRHESFLTNLHALRDLLDSAGVVPHSPGLRDRLWIGTASESGFALAANLGLGVLTGRSSSPAGPRDEIAAGRAAAYIKTAASPRVGMSRSVLCATNAQLALDHLRPGIDRWLAEGKRSGRFPAGYDAQQYVDAGHAYLGTTSDVRDALRRDLVMPYATDVLCNVQPSTPSHAAILNNLRLFGRDVIGGWST
ncbi:alkanesulfonate monooxygenase SsuD/methylene tetrahydromethanopterin reductase-like flavin-dependent oxidoreductase (luciferase family) [Antricoccus suffuscus]|uniref:Alkanesulfonate monooxygenase SsuD/methylene tetrahydromethanopterin reductase-like flavin-dependent oxidoreductase (Luciferase family) n=1 Tax=Antricoccus suffuscus TaxID=1629062 RepID=A0A2T0ZWM1_9ACTN|nr:LLM class flavin-dependent oxidoreductase [Antricoccus suffuscus]PRZ40478.1 alkanesulfonate monooxygenase SsuD/methylene tetrahydromethanopterin reductase-like flavin-dependent oxidoreductase (luciferase family) [Antricoccus suffuscus]